MNCSHGTNPKACPICFRLAPPKEAKIEAPPVQNQIPQGQVMDIGEATMRATQSRRASVPQLEGGSIREPYSSSNPVPSPEAFGGEKLWKPSKHKEIITRLPRHPHANAPARTLKA